MDKTVDEKQVVFWSEKYAKRAKADRAAALAKAADLTQTPGNYTRATSYGAAKYVKKVDFDKDSGEILTASSVLELDEELIRQEERFDGYYVLLTSEMEEPDDKNDLFDYCDETLKYLGDATGIDFSKRIRTLGEIKKILADTKKQKIPHEKMTKRQSRLNTEIEGIFKLFLLQKSGIEQSITSIDKSIKYF